MGTIISWNVPNWITVVLMVVLMYAAVAMFVKVFGAVNGSGEAAANA